MAEEIGSNEDFWHEVQDYMFSEDKLEKAPEEVENITELTDVHSGRVLDLPCGVGRHSVEFSKEGWNVTAVDLISPYLDEAKQRAKEEGVDIEFVEEDMRKFKRDDSFDLIIHLWNSFGYFEDAEDDRTVLENFFSSLKKGGKLVMDVNGKEIVDPGEVWDREGDDEFFLHKYEIKEDYNKFESTWVLIKEGEVMEYHPSFRLYSAIELKNLLSEVGFSNIEVYGDFRGSEYNSESDNLIIIATK